MDGQWMSNNAKRNLIIYELNKAGGEATYEALFQVSDSVHCDILAAALGSCKRDKAVTFDGMMLLYPTHKDVVVKLKNPDYLADFFGQEAAPANAPAPAAEDKPGTPEPEPEPEPVKPEPPVEETKPEPEPVLKEPAKEDPVSEPKPKPVPESTTKPEPKPQPPAPKPAAASGDDPRALNYMKLKKWMLAKGVPKPEVDACPDKDHLLLLMENLSLA